MFEQEQELHGSTIQKTDSVTRNVIPNLVLMILITEKVSKPHSWALGPLLNPGSKDIRF